MLPRTLFGRLLLIFMIFGTVMTGALLVVMQVSHRMYHREFDQTVNRDLARSYVAANFLLTDAPLTVDTLHDGIHKLAAANPEVDIYLVDANGGIVASSVPQALRRRSRIDMRPIRSFLAGKGAPILADDPRDARRQEVFSAAPFHIKDCPASVLYIVLRREEERPGAGRLRTEYAVGEGAGVILTAAVLSIALSLLFLKLLTRRLGVLESAIRRFSDANGVSSPAQATTADGDEVDRLEVLFRDLTERIESQMEALKSTDVMRRDQLANVSHDLRTPLTTLLAHLETLQMKQSELTEAQRNEFLEVAKRQSLRIGLLVEQLLEAAKLEAGQVNVNPEPFLIGELLQDVVEKFSIVARERGINLSHDSTAVGVMVKGDIALLERVLDNLIENALRHTPGGGHVTVRSDLQRDSIRISVTDTGPGVSNDEVRRIFDRFYRGDPGRSSHSGQSGLGLSIAKAILELHGCQIAVDSEPAHGAKFYFDLPLVSRTHDYAPT